MGIKIWLDDERPAPEGWLHIKTPWEAIDLIKAGDVDWIHLDHDLGLKNCVPPNNGYHVAKFIEEGAVNGTLAPLKVAVHTANPVGRKNICMAIQNAYKHWKGDSNES